MERRLHSTTARPRPNLPAPPPAHKGSSPCKRQRKHALAWYSRPISLAQYLYQQQGGIPVKHAKQMIAAVLAAGAVALPVSAAVYSAQTTAAGGNAAPIAEQLTLDTYQGIAISSRFAAVDPEGDPVTFQVVDSPARGKVTVDEQDPAPFWYTPYEGKKGKDTFTYVAVDSQGNVSQPATVKITISKQSTKVSYWDMEGDPGHYDALRLAEAGVYVGRQVGSHYCFDPQATFCREEFLALAMAVVGSDPLDGVTLTGFSDDESISAWAKGYVSAALLEGAVTGSRNEQGQAVFLAGNAITRAEAAVMANRLLALQDSTATASAALKTAPAWASQSGATLGNLSALPLGGDLNQPLTRSEAAQLLCDMADVVERRSSGWAW